MKTESIEYPNITTREKWLKARKDLLEAEKEHTRAGDLLNTKRRELPMVEVDASYVFRGPNGDATLLDLFEGRPQLIVYHFMWNWENGQPEKRPCRSCSGWADQHGRGIFAQLRGTGTTLSLVSGVPYENIAVFKEEMKWQIPWYSSMDSSFNRDYHVTIDPKSEDPVYNYRTRTEHKKAGSESYFYSEELFELPGLSCFLRVGEKIYHTYSTYGRGCEATCNGYHLLDLTALGRQEDWELPKGRDLGMGEIAGSEAIKYPDEYEKELQDSCCH